MRAARCYLMVKDTLKTQKTLHKRHWMRGFGERRETLMHTAAVRRASLVLNQPDERDQNNSEIEQDKIHFVRQRQGRDQCHKHNACLPGRLTTRDQYEQKHDQAR